MFLGPIFLELLLRHLQSGGGAAAGFGLACGLAASAVVETLSVNW